MYSETVNNDIGLQQGQVLKGFNNTHSKYIDFKKIMTTCAPDVCSMKEGMDSAIRNGNNTNVENTTKHIQDLDDKFSRTLSNYNRLQKQIKEEVIQKSQNYETWKNHLGKVVVNSDNHYYVNNYGYTHKYSKSGLNANHNSCPSYTNANSINNKMLDDMPTGDDMKPGQACQIAGKNIRNKTTDEHAYVDVRGVKHVYSVDSWRNKKSLCDSHALSISNSAYKAIPSGHNMTDKDLCIKVDVDPRLFTQMYRLNNELTTIGKELYREIHKLNIKDAKTKEHVNEKKKQVDGYIQTLDKERIELVDYEKNFDTVSAQETDSELKMTSDYYQYLVIGIVALAVGGITVKVLVNSD